MVSNLVNSSSYCKTEIKPLLTDFLSQPLVSMIDPG